jgi:hypothetical protein
VRQAAKREAIAALVSQLEGHNPLQQPTRHLQQVAGAWRLLYTTITITVGARSRAWGVLTGVGAVGAVSHMAATDPTLCTVHHLAAVHTTGAAPAVQATLHEPC